MGTATQRKPGGGARSREAAPPAAREERRRCRPGRSNSLRNTGGRGERPSPRSTGGKGGRSLRSAGTLRNAVRRKAGYRTHPGGKSRVRSAGKPERRPAAPALEGAPLGGRGPRSERRWMSVGQRALPTHTRPVHCSSRRVPSRTVSWQRCPAPGRRRFRSRGRWPNRWRLPPKEGRLWRAASLLGPRPDRQEKRRSPVYREQRGQPR